MSNANVETNQVERLVIPKYVATCIDDDTITDFGEGDTPEEAYEEFMSNGCFDDYCAWVTPVGTVVDVYVYTVIDIKDSGFELEEIEEGWKWCLDKKISTIPTASV